MRELWNNSFCNARTSFKVKKLITKLNDVVAIAIHDEIVNIESYIKD